MLSIVRPSFSSRSAGIIPPALHAALGSSNMSQADWVVKRPLVILFGDSLTERSFSPLGGWGASLAHHLYRRVDVINRGFSGYNTRWAMHLVEEVFGDCTRDNTAMVTLFFGANDAGRLLPEGNVVSSRQHVPVEEYKENMRKMVKFIRDRGVREIVLITAPPVYEPARKEAARQRMGAEAETMGLDRTNNFTKLYAEACQEVAKELGLPVVDLWSSMQADKDWGTKLLTDGLHFTVEGNQFTFDALLGTINATYPSLRAEALPIQFPAWDAIDGGPRSAAFTKLPRQ